MLAICRRKRRAHPETGTPLLQGPSRQALLTRVGKTKVFRTPLGELRPHSLLDSNVSQNSSRNLCPKYPPLFSFQNSIAYPFDGLSVRKFPFLEVTPNRLGQPRALCYQYGGESESGLGPIGSPDNWRCVV